MKSQIPNSQIPKMVKRKSKIICPKCGERGGALTTRLTGHSKKRLSVYIHHYCPERRAGKRPCYISRHGIAHILLADKRYESAYKPLVKYWKTAAREELPNKEQLKQLLSQAARLLIDMGWPDHSIASADKFSADIYEISVEELALGFREDGIEIDHDVIAKKFFKEQIRTALYLTERRKKNSERQHRRVGS